MKILLATQDKSTQGGAQIFLNRFVQVLNQRGHQLVLDAPSSSELYDWVIAQKAESPAWLSKVRTLAKHSLYLMHDYRGLCISGTKLHSFPSKQHCSKPFSSSCLVHFFPRRCGGRSPVTLLKAYHQGRQLLAEIKKFQYVGANSHYLQTLLADQGVSNTLLYHPGIIDEKIKLSLPPMKEPFVILFAGRMVPEKGVETLVRAAARLSQKWSKKFILRLSGTGTNPTYEKKLMQLGERLSARSPHWTIEWSPWKGKEVSEEYPLAHVLAFPSLWPEPFGMTGIEAAAHGTPAVAFGGGGVKDWLKDGTTGVLAKPGVDGLADALLKVLSDLPTLLEMRKRAYEHSHRFFYPQCISTLLQVLEADSKSNDLQHRKSAK